jgi:hypothetical protein
MLSYPDRSIHTLREAIRTSFEDISRRLMHWEMQIAAILSAYKPRRFVVQELTPPYRINDKLENIFRASGLKVARQSFEYKSAGQTYNGQNIYAILHAPRGDATEAIVLIGAWRNVEGLLNRSGVALVLTLARYFKSMHPRSIESAF